MRVVVVHNHYRSNVPSGENRTVREICSQLAEAGVEILAFERFSDDIASMSMHAKLRLPLAPIHSFEAVTAFKKLLHSSRPDVVQVHNVYPMVSPSIVREARQANVPVVGF